MRVDDVGALGADTPAGMNADLYQYRSPIDLGNARLRKLEASVQAQEKQAKQTEIHPVELRPAIDSFLPKGRFSYMLGDLDGG